MAPLCKLFRAIRPIAQTLAVALAAVQLTPPEAARADEGEDLGDLSIEALMEVEVTSVSKRAQPLSEAAAAVTGINGEDIRRSGHTSIPELLRMVPGLAVANIDANKWSITQRVFMSATKLNTSPYFSVSPNG